MKRFVFFLATACIFCTLLTGCKDYVSSEEQKRAAIEPGYGTITFSVADSLFAQNSRTVLPNYTNGYRIDFFIYDDAAKRNYVWGANINSFEEFAKTEITLKEGVYYADCSVYAKVSDGSGGFYDSEAFTKNWQKAEIKEGSTFTFEITKEDYLSAACHGNKNGSAFITVVFPKENASSCSLMFCDPSDFTIRSDTYLDSSHDSYEEFTEGGVEYIKFSNVEVSLLEMGYYYLSLTFYTAYPNFIQACRMGYVLILPGAESHGEFIYKDLNKRYSIFYERGDVNFLPDLTRDVDYPESFSITDSITLPDETFFDKEHYVIEGWYTDSALTQKIGTDGFTWNAGTYKDSINVYPKWTAQKFRINFQDRLINNKSGTRTKAYSGTGDSYMTVEYGTGVSLVTPTSSLNTAENPVEFAGWYTNQACTGTAVTSFASGEIESNITLYASWKYKNIYIDPENGSDTNYGNSATAPLKTVHEAFYSFGGTITDRSLYVMNTITSDDDINALTGLSSASFANAVLRRHSSFTDSPVITVSGTPSTTIYALTVDGGAVWQDNNVGQAGAGCIVSTAPLITVESGASITLSDGTVLQNNYNKNDGGAIYNSGTLSFSGINSKIQKNYTEENGGGIFCYDGTAFISSITIQENKAAKNGGGIYLPNNGAAATPGIQITGGKIKENSASNAGAAYLFPKKSTDSFFHSVNIEENKVSGSGNYGALFVLGEGFFTLNDCTVKENGGTKGAIGVSGCLYLAGNNKIYENNVSDIYYNSTNTSKISIKESFTIQESLPPSEKTKIASSKYPSETEPYVKIMEFDSNIQTSNIEKIHEMFTVTSSGSTRYALGTYTDPATSTTVYGSIIKAPVASGFVHIQSGSFKRATNSSGDNAHTVTLTRAFDMCDHEVTQKEYETYCGYSTNSPDASKGLGDDYPAYFVSWYDAIVYCNLRSIAEGLSPVYKLGTETNPRNWTGIKDCGSEKYCCTYDSSNPTWNSITQDLNANGYRLPTEAEWQYAALASFKDSPNWNGFVDTENSASVIFSGYSGTSSDISVYCWFYENSEESSHQTKTKASNSYGLYDMSGNVSEYVWDWYTTYSGTDQTDPTGDETGSNRVSMGCGWNIPSDYASLMDSRETATPNTRENTKGFRVCRTAN